MITKITETNSLKYQTLFAKVNTLLQEYNSGLANLPIKNLSGYFSHLGDIKNAVAAINGDLAQFLLIPTDEELFEINLNTRQIKVPQFFQTEGIGVLNDNTAEILYFSVDRYYDLMDLADTNILIQYKDAKGNSNFCEPWIRSTNLLENKLVFGWVVDNDVTDFAGNIQFSIRFYLTDNEEVIDLEHNSPEEIIRALNDEDRYIYALNTTITTVKIKNGLDIIQNLVNINNHSAIIFNRLKNYAPNGLIISDLPYIIGYYNFINQDISADTENSGVIGVAAMTAETTAAVLSYSLEKKNILDNEQITWSALDGSKITWLPLEHEWSEAENNAFKIQKIQAKEVLTTFVENCQYFTNENGYNPVINPTKEQFNSGKYFIDIYTIDFNQIDANDLLGEYRIVISNTEIGNDEDNPPRPATAYSEKPIILNAPKEPVISSVNAINDFYEDTNNLPILKVNMKSESLKNPNYFWYRDNVKIDEAMNASYQPTDEGEYKVQITNNLNKQSSNANAVENTWEIVKRPQQLELQTIFTSGAGTVQNPYEIPAENTIIQFNIKDSKPGKIKYYTEYITKLDNYVVHDQKAAGWNTIDTEDASSISLTLTYDSMMPQNRVLVLYQEKTNTKVNKSTTSSSQVFYFTIPNME